MITNEMVNQAIEYIMQHVGETITDIGYDYGYSPSNYSSAFKQHHHETPVNFRKNILKKSIRHPFYNAEKNEMMSFQECNQFVSIETIKDMFVIYERRIGSYHNLKEEWDSFQRKYEEYINKDTLFLERTFDDPSITDTDSCLYDICMIANETCQLENTYKIEGGKFAVYHFKGYVKQIYTVYQTMFNVWFQKSQYEIDERYGFDIYREIDCDRMYMEIDICMPVK